MIILLGNYGNFDLEKKFWNDEVSSINWLEDLIVCYVYFVYVVVIIIVFYLVLFDIIYCINIYVKIGMLMIKVVLLVIEF